MPSRTLVVQLDVDELEKLVRGVVRDELLALREESEAASASDADGGELEPLLTVSQLAEVLNCGVRTLKRWLQEGVAPPPVETPGCGLRWYRPAVRRWLEERCPESGETQLLHGRERAVASRR